MYHITKDDVINLVRACKRYQEATGSEYMWEKYQKLIEKLNIYYDQNYEENFVNTNSNHPTNTH